MEDEHPVLLSNEACENPKTSRTMDNKSDISEQHMDKDNTIDKMADQISDINLGLVRNDS